MKELESELLYKEALKLESSGALPKALSAFKNLVEKHPNDPRFWIAFGTCLIKKKYWKEACAKLKTGLALKPHYGEAYARLCYAEALEQAKDIKSARAHAKLVSEMKPVWPYEHQTIKMAKKMLKRL